MKDVIVIAAGGHARVLVDLLRLTGRTIIAIADPRPHSFNGIRHLPDDGEVRTFDPAEVELVNAVGSAGVPEARRAIFDKFKAWNYTFATLVHPSAVIAGDVLLEEGAQVMAGAVIQTGSRIGRNTIVNTRASIDHDARIGAHVHVAPGVTLSGNVTIGEMVHIGTGATAIQDVTIGDASLVAAGAVVVRDLPPRSHAAGVPARTRK
ncbi:MAG TPA: acetyltransferase [Thermoanaerobaculia bacterium]|nr:acetyltransferase [Thermoanaerobaculia bacterium]